MGRRLMIDLSQHELHRFANTVESDASIIGRDDVADRVIGALGRRTPQPVLVVGAPGSGRTTALSAVRRHLDGERGRSVSRRTMLRIDCGLLAEIGGAALRAARDTAGPTELIALDDLDVLLGLGAHTFDTDLAAVVRAMVHDRKLRIVATLDNDYLAQFQAREPGLASGFENVDLPPLDDEPLRVIARNQADQLEAHHKVALPAGTAELAAGPGPPGGRLAHPALLVTRLDAACVHARLRGSDLVEPGDVDVFHTDPSSEVVDPDELGAALRERVSGQDHAVEVLTRRLSLTSRQLDLTAHRPDGAFLFVGPTGVGKTELALALAEARFADETRVIRLDMSEFREEHSVSRIIGPPPGYIGSDAPSGWLTTRVRQQPQSVVLLDEIEKANPAVWMLLLQILDAGRLTDGRGEVASFSDAVVIMTSNLGTQYHSTVPVGFASDTGAPDPLRDQIMTAVRAAMPPELVNRIDDVVVFRPLSLAVIEQIAVGMVARAVATLSERGWAIEVDPDVVTRVAGLGYDSVYGARHLKRAVEQHLLASLATLPPGRYRAALRDGEITWEQVAAPPSAPEREAGDAPPRDAESRSMPVGADPVRLRASLRFGTGERSARSLVVTAGGGDSAAVAALIVEAVTDPIVVEEAAELLVDPMTRPVVIDGLSPTAANDLHRRLIDAGADAVIAGMGPS